MGWISKLFGDDDVPSSTDIAVQIVKKEQECASLGERLETARAAALRASQSGRGDRAERVKRDGLAADLSNERDHLQALHKAYAEQVAAEQLRELNARWDLAEQYGVKLLTTLQRLHAAIDAVGREYGQSITQLNEFSSSLPSRARDLSPLAIDTLVRLRLGALSAGQIGTSPPEAPDILLEGAANLIEQARDHIAVGLRARPAQPAAEKESTDAPAASPTTAGE